MDDVSLSNKRIAKNTIILYVRMLIILLVNLYSSRVVLRELGAEDFGIYNIVGGFVAMFGFLNATMSGATSRFLAFSLGQNDIKKLTDTFKTSLILHFVIAVIIFIIAETIGLWFINNKLVIPDSRITAANMVYQLSIFTMLLKTIQVPLNAIIISHERMHVYALIEVINAIVILVFLFLLPNWENDKLVFYAFMICFVAFCVLNTYIIYCKNQFEECRLKFSFDFNWEIMKPMLSFSCFDLYGNMCVSARTQGINIILNMFFGAIINAANGIATQVQAAILMISSNISLAFRPRIVKSYATNELVEMEKLVYSSSKISMLLFSIFAIPLILEMPYVLHLWLGVPPEHTISITRIAIIICWIGALNSILTIPIHATGKIKELSLYGGTIYLLTLPVTYCLLMIYNIPEIAYLIMLLFMFVLLFTTCWILKRRISQFSMISYWIKNVIPSIGIIIMATIIVIPININMKEGIYRLLLVLIVYFVAIIPLSYLFLLNKNQRGLILAYVKNKFVI